MSFTNSAIVKKHLSEFRVPVGKIENVMVQLTGTESLTLGHKGIKSLSEKVKGKVLNEPVSQVVQLGDEWTILNNQELISESVVVASNSSLTEVYKENLDYMVEYNTGKLLRIEDGNIQNDQSVTVWYFYYKQFQKGVDYYFNYNSGTIQRIPEGSVEDGQFVWIDYVFETGGFSDESLSRAINEAHTVLISRIDEEYQDSSNQILEVIETYLALDILARMKSLEVLQSEFLEVSQKQKIGENYLNLGSSYRKEAEDLVRPFLKKEHTLALPIKIRSKS